MAPLPPAPNSPSPLPAQPQNPPTLTDIAEAIEYNSNIRISRAAGGATNDDVARGAIYETALIQESAGPAVAPPWFAQAIAPTSRIAQKSYNMLCGDGHIRPFQTVVFTNGEDPVATHNLPALNNVGDINALTGPEAALYLHGYNLPPLHSIQNRKEAIRVEIGCLAHL